MDSKEFEKFWKEYLATCDEELVAKVTDLDKEFVKGYVFAMDNIQNYLINAKVDAVMELGNYTALKEFVEQVCQLMYDETKMRMESSLDTVMTEMVESKCE